MILNLDYFTVGTQFIEFFVKKSIISRNKKPPTEVGGVFIYITIVCKITAAS